MVWMSNSMKLTLRSTAVLGAKNSSILNGGYKSKTLDSTENTFFIKA